MSIKLYELCGKDGLHFSPYCWRAHMAMRHKQLAFETVSTSFTAISSILDGTHKRVPVLEAQGSVVAGSFEIAEFLERSYPDQPSLFGSAEGLALARFMDCWSNALHPDIARIAIKDIHDKLEPDDQAYFRKTREAVFGKTLEEVQDGRDLALLQLQQKLQPLSKVLQSQPFVSGKTPRYSDHIVFGSLHWAVLVADFPLLDSFEQSICDWYFGFVTQVNK